MHFEYRLIIITLPILMTICKKKINSILLRNEYIKLKNFLNEMAIYNFKKGKKILKIIELKCCIEATAIGIDDDDDDELY